MIFVHNSALRDSDKTVNGNTGKRRASEHICARLPCKKTLIRKDPFRSTPMRKPRSFGYIRVSTRAQAPDRQIEALYAECDELHTEQVSAVAHERPVFERVISKLQTGDSFVVMDLDRAFRSSIDAILTAEHLRQIGVTFRILSMAIDTSTPEGELYYTMIAGFAQFERRIISRRTKGGLVAARARGVKLGRKPKLTDQEIRCAYRKLPDKTCEEIAQTLGVSRITLQRGFKRLDLVKTIDANTRRLPES